MIDKLIGSHTTKDSRPDSAGRIITMGVDRGKWNYVEIREWFFDQWSLDINADAVCNVVYYEKFIDEDFDRRMNTLMREWQVLACVLDADPHPLEARRFARRFPGFVWLSRFRSGQTAREIAITEEDSSSPMATCDRANWLSASLGRFKSDPRRICLPKDISHEYREHMKALVSTYVRDQYDNPILDFIATKDDHFALAGTYAEIALPLVAAQKMNQDIKSFR